MESDLRKLAVRTINEYIHEIEYAGTLVLAYKYGGCVNYINASKLCKDDGKEFFHWIENKKSQSLIDCLFTHINFGMTREEIEKANIGLPMSEHQKVREVLIKVQGGSNVEIRGTYVHQHLLPHIMCWLSPAFAIKVSEIVNRYYIDEKDKKIFSLEITLAEIKDQNKKILSELEDVNSRLDETQATNERNEDKLILLTNGIETLSVNEISRDQYCTKPINKSMIEVLVISTIHILLNNRKKRIIIINRAQSRNYKTTRDRMISRILKRPEHNNHVKCNPFITPHIILEDANVIQTWASFKFANRENISVENGIITILRKDFKLIESICSYIGIQRKPIDQLQKEYEALLRCKDSEEEEESFD